MFTDRFSYMKIVIAVIILAAVLGCNKQETGDNNNGASGNSKPVKAKAEETIKEPEKTIAVSDTPYLLLDVPRRMLIIKMRGTVLKEMPFTLGADSMATLASVEALKRDSVKICTIEKIHLFAAAEKFGDTLVSIVSSATNARKDQIQHYIPQHMTFICTNGIMISTESEVDGKTVSFWENQIESAKVFMKQVFTGTELVTLRLESEDAMSLYGVSQAGLAIIIVTS